MSCETCEARKTDLQTGDEYCKELGALIAPGAVKCSRQQEEKKWPVGGVDRTGKTDKISLVNAVETPFWMAIWATEPERMVEVEMSYSDLKILCDLIDEKRKDGWIPVKKEWPPFGRRLQATILHHEWISDYDSAWVPEEEKVHHAAYIEVCEIYPMGAMWCYACAEDDYHSDIAYIEPAKDLSGPVAEIIAWRPFPEPYNSEKDN